MDSLIDFLLLRFSGKPNRIVRNLLASRKEAVNLLRRSYPHRKLVLDLVTICSSFRIQRLLKKKMYEDYDAYRFDDVSAMTCLSQVESLSQSSTYDPFETLHLRTLLIGLLSSRLEDLSVPEYQKQQWFACFADHSFWMSSTKVAMILVSAMRAKYFEELRVLRHGFTQEDWRSAGFFLSTAELTALPPVFQELVSRKNAHGYSRILANSLLSHYRTHSVVQLAKAMRVFVRGQIDENEISLLTQPFFNASSVYEVLQDPKSILDFSIATAIVLFKPVVANQFWEKMMDLAIFATYKSPVLEVFAVPSLLASKTPSEFRVKQVFKIGKSKPDSSPGNVVEMLSSLSLMLIRNFVTVIEAALQSETHCLIGSKADFNEPFSLTCLSGPTLFKKLCLVVLSYDIVKEDMTGDLETLGFFQVMRTASIPDFLKTILIEAIISMYLTRNLPLPLKFLNLRIDHTFSLSKSLSKLRRVRKIMPAVDLLRLLKPYMHSQEQTVSWVAIWAILPCMTEDEDGARQVSTVLNALVNSNYPPVLQETILTLLLEYSSFDTFKVLLEEYSQYFPRQNMSMCLISLQKRTIWLFSKEIAEFASLSEKRRRAYHRLAIYFSFKTHIPVVEPTEYSKSYFAGELPFCHKSIGRSIVSAVSRIILDQEQRIFPKSFLEAIFLDTGDKYVRKVRERIRFEIEMYLYLTLLSKDFLLHIVNSLSFLEGNQRGTEKILLKDIDKLYKTSDSPLSIQDSIPKKQCVAVIPIELQVTSLSRPTRNRTRAPKPRRNRCYKEKISVELKPKEEKEEKQQQSQITLESKTDYAQTEVQTRKSSEHELSTVKEDDGSKEQKEKETLTRLNLKQLGKNSVIASNGCVRPKDSPSKLFQMIIYERLKEGGGIPFNLDPQFFAFITKGEKKEEFAQSTWKPIRGWIERETWKPKVFYPVRVFGKRLEMAQIHLLKKYVRALPETLLARVQSLVFYSNNSSDSLLDINGPYSVKHMSSRWTLKFEIIEGLQEYKVENGWIHTPCIPSDSSNFTKRWKF